MGQLINILKELDVVNFPFKKEDNIEIDGKKGWKYIRTFPLTIGGVTFYELNIFENPKTGERVGFKNKDLYNKIKDKTIKKLK